MSKSGRVTALASLLLLGVASCGSSERSADPERTSSADLPSTASGPSGGGTYSAAHPESSDSSTAAGWLTDETAFNDRLRKLNDEDSDCLRVQTLADAYASLVAFPASKPLFIDTLQQTAAEAPNELSDALTVIEEWLHSSDTAAVPSTVLAANGTIQAFLDEQCA